MSRRQKWTAHGMPHLSPYLLDISLPLLSSLGYSMPSLSPDLRTETAQTPAEREREQSLLDDPYARVLGPSCVQCRQCLKKIKLSTKSAYDTFHWRNHRARCLRAMKKKLKATEAAVRLPSHKLLVCTFTYFYLFFSSETLCASRLSFRCGHGP